MIEFCAPVRADRGDRCDRDEVGQVRHRHARRRAQEGIGAGVATGYLNGDVIVAAVVAIDVRPVQRTQRGIRNARPLRTRQRQVTDVGKYQVGAELAQQIRLVGDTPIPVRVVGAVGRAAFLDQHVQRRRHHHADIAFTGQMCERRIDARAQMGKRHGGTHRQTQVGKQLMQPVQDGRRLRDMAKTVAGYADDEVRGIAHQFWL